MFYYDWTYLLIIPGLILGLWAQHKVKSAYAEYSRISTRLGRSAASVVDDLLRRNGNNKVRIGRVSGELTDHYNPADETLKLSDGVYASSSIAALGIAAHEAGHAMQKHENYAPLRLRTAIVPAVNICSGLSTPLFFLGLLMSWEPLLTLGIILFAASTVFALVTLPVEFALTEISPNSFSMPAIERWPCSQKVAMFPARKNVACAKYSMRRR